MPPTARLPALLFGFTMLFVGMHATEALHSPDGKLAVTFTLGPDGDPHYRVTLSGRPVLLESRLGLLRDDADFTRGLALLDASAVTPVADHYELLTGKRRLNIYRAQRQIYHLATSAGLKLDVIFQVSDDGVAYRYFFPEPTGAEHSINEEVSSFHFPAGTKAWLQPMSVAKSGWKANCPAYEEYYQREIDAGTPSTLGAGWVFPALFHTGGTWVLLTEAGLGRTYCGSRLRHESPGGDYTIGFPDPRETMDNAPVNPSSVLPWSTPWRIITVGPLATIIESTLGTDLADPTTEARDPGIRPGKASWSWPLLGDQQTVYEVQRRFVDFAADMGWAYCLVDGLWDTQIGYSRIKELADYARTKNIGLLLWYNSNGNWNDAPQTPKDRMVTHAARIAEFERLKAMGIRGLKVDFFGGDGERVIGYYHDILQDAAPYGFLMNFHGATLPRGWQRTYPHLMTMEAIKGFEYITFDQKNADEEPVHATTIPFTRNAFDPMDFTPVCLDRLPGGKLRRTTGAFELALSIVFYSGIQHYPETPEGMAKMPDYVKDFMRHVPAVWDDTKFLDGYPGKSIVLARQGDGRWFVAGLNGEAMGKSITLDLSRIAATGHGWLITDGTGSLFQRAEISWRQGEPVNLTLKPNGGFVLVVERSH